MWPTFFVSLIVLCWTGVSESSLQCPWSRFHLGRINTNIIVLLESMGGYLPVQCVDSQTVHIFPENVFTDAEEDAVPLLVLQTLQLFTEVFAGNLSSVSWNRDKVELLRNLVSRQTTKLQECVDQDGVTDTGTTATALASLSDQLTTIHTQEECAWELRRSEFHIVFVQLKTFLDNRGK